MLPDWPSNLQPFDLQDDVRTSRPHQPRQAQSLIRSYNWEQVLAQMPTPQRDLICIRDGTTKRVYLEDLFARTSQGTQGKESQQNSGWPLGIGVERGLLRERSPDHQRPYSQISWPLSQAQGTSWHLINAPILAFE